MIILMKMVSVGFDLDSSSLTRLPSLFEMVGYIMNPGTVIFGPWISFSTYKKVLQPMSWVRQAFWIDDSIRLLLFFKTEKTNLRKKHKKCSMFLIIIT